MDNNNTLMDTLAQRLLQQGEGVSSSATSRIQREVQSAINQTQRAGDATSTALSSARDREISFARNQAGLTYTTAQEERRGYGTQVVALRDLVETTEKEIKDLDQRYQEAILMNDAQTAQRVSSLQMQKLEFMQQQEQSFYANLISLANLQEQAAGREQAGEQFRQRLEQDESEFTRRLGLEESQFEKQVANEERQQLLGLAAQYGVNVGENETMESMIQKISPFVSQERSLELEQMRASIAASKASAARAAAGEAGDGRLDDFTLDALAMAYINGEKDVVTGIRTPEQGGQLAARVSQMRNEIDSELENIAKNVNSAEQFVRWAEEAPRMYRQEDVDRMAQKFAGEWASNVGETTSSTRRRIPVDTEVTINRNNPVVRFFSN